jgi:hypothetical protein
MKLNTIRASKPSTDAPPSNQKTPFTIWVLMTALLLAFTVENVIEMRRESSTSDELVKLAGGYSCLLKGDLRLNRLHPPLLKIISALPLLALHPKIDFTDPAWEKPPKQWKFSSHFLYSNNADQLLFWGRIPVLLLALWLGFFIFRWAQRLYGSIAGLFALALYSFSPNFIAHSHLITLDAGVAALVTISFYFLWSHFRSGEKLALLWSALFMAAALASKYSSFGMLPCFVFLLWIVYRRDSLKSVVSASQNVRKSDKRNSKEKLKGGGARNGSETGFMANHEARSPVATPGTKKLQLFILICSGLVGAMGFLAYLHAPVVRSLLGGLALVKGYEHAQYPNYWHGSFVNGGGWYFFLGTFLVKSTAGVLILILGRFLVFLKNWRSEWQDSLFLCLPAVVYFVVVSTFANPIGVRYLLPTYSLQFVFVSGLVRYFARQRVVFWVLWLLVGWHTASSLAAFPASLSYFNEFVGGPSHGTEWLDDSNVDWGQELKTLKAVLDEHQISNPTLISFSFYDNPEYYGIRCVRPPQEDWLEIFQHPRPGFYAISGHWLARAEGLGFAWKLHYPVIANVGNSMFVFQVP